MTRTFLTVALGGYLLATTAYAQTTDPAATPEGSGMASVSGTFGSDWSTTLGAAVFADDGTTVRSTDELAAQWETLSDDDKNLIRRDCMLYMQQSGGSADADATGSDTTNMATDGTATDGAGTATDSNTGTGAGTASATDGSAAQNTAPTDGTASDGAATGDADASTTTGAASGVPMTVGSEQMTQICAATKDL